MRSLLSGLTMLFVTAFWLIAGPTGLSAQLIGVKTVPLATGNQFDVIPSRNAGMGGLSIAIADPLLDPFNNPALGVQPGDSRLWGAPVYYSVSGSDGSARTLPVGAVFGSSSWFGGLSFALQQLEAADRNPAIVFLRDFDIRTGQQPLSEKNANNVYVTGVFGRRLPGTRLTAGLSATYADLNALDGVDLLYALSQRIEQNGYMSDIRVGVAGETGQGESIEAVVVRNRFDMSHEVTYLEWTFCTPEHSAPCTLLPRTERNRDHTDTWGAHVRYRRPVGEAGWRIGLIATANWKSHPKIPDYEIMNIPRDPGNTSAYDIGIGIAREIGATTFGVDVVWEPIWSDTWAEADSVIRTAGGRQILPGQKTVENEFSFSNAIMRMGAGHETEKYGLSLGLQVRSYSYTLQQQDNVRRTWRDQSENWMEWTPTWGAVLKLPELHIRYTGRLTTGTGRPGVAWGGPARAALDNAELANFIVAPSGPLTLQDATVVLHQLTVSLPIH